MTAEHSPDAPVTSPDGLRARVQRLRALEIVGRSPSWAPARQYVSWLVARRHPGWWRAGIFIVGLAVVIGLLLVASGAEGWQFFAWLGGAFALEVLVVRLAVAGSDTTSVWYRRVERSVDWFGAAMISVLAPTALVLSLLTVGAVVHASWGDVVVLTLLAGLLTVQAWIFTDAAVTLPGRSSARTVSLFLEPATALVLIVPCVLFSIWLTVAKGFPAELSAAIGIALVSALGAWAAMRGRRRRRVLTEVVAAADALVAWSVTRADHSPGDGVHACLRLERALATRLAGWSDALGFRVADEIVRRSLIVYAHRIGRVPLSPADGDTGISAAVAARLARDLVALPTGTVHDEVRSFSVALRQELSRWVDSAA